jgi:hypothetical protein
MPPILITTLVAAPILALGTSLYLHRRGLSPRVRMVLMTVLFLFILISGPVIAWMWMRRRIARDMAHYGGGGLMEQMCIVWFLGVIGVGAQLFRFYRRKGKLDDSEPPASS